MKPQAKPQQGKNSLTQKPFRFWEFIIEKGIATVAMAALVAIVLIFVFVFRESAVVLKGPAEAKHAKADTAMQMESYGEPAAEEKMETYGEPAPAEGQMESYGESAPVELSHTDSIAQGLLEEGPKVDPKEQHSKELRSMAGMEWQPVSDDPKYGVFPLFWGSLKIAMIAVLFGAPIAILAALYTTVFAPKWAREFLKPTIELLAGFPSVVIGFFALVVMATFFQNLFGLEYRLNAFVGGIAMSLAVIPVIYTLSEDALSTVPNSYKEASVALGAHPWETAIYVILPAALPGIFAGVLLGVGRAIGETMIALMATGNAALIGFDIVEPVRTLSASIGAEMAEVVVGDMHYGVLFSLGALLFLVSFTLNFTVEFFVRQYLMKKFRGA